jgi:hypothetical protein
MKLEKFMRLVLSTMLITTIVSCGSSSDEEGNPVVENQNSNPFNNGGSFNQQVSTYANNPNLTIEQIRQGVNEGQFSAQPGNSMVAYFYKSGNDMCYYHAANCGDDIDHQSVIYSLNNQQTNLYEGGHLGYFNQNSLPSNLKQITYSEILNHLIDLVNNGQFINYLTGSPVAAYPNIHSVGVCGGLGFWIRKNDLRYLISLDCPVFMNPVRIIEDEDWFPSTKRELQYFQAF